MSLGQFLEAAARTGSWRGGKAIAGLCLLMSGLGTFALDRALHKPAPVSESSLAKALRPVSPIIMASGGWVQVPLLTGTEAPDFRLPDSVHGHEVHLADLRSQKPVVLIFGSFSCDVFVSELAVLERFYQEHRNQAEFLLVYVMEAGHLIPELDPILDAIPAGPDRQRQRVLKGRDCLHLSIPTVLDSGNYPVQTMYRAFPRRMVVVDSAGRIALDLGKGLENAPWDLASVHAWLQSNSPASPRR